MAINKSAIIFGISGQDGSYLAHFLLSKNYKVVGVTRNKNYKNLYRLKKLKILEKVKLIQGNASDKKFCNKLIKKNIDEIYFLSGYSSVIGSFEDPFKSMNSNVIGLLNILEEIKKKKLKLKLFNAGSGQFYGNNKKNTYGLYSKIDPQSPYGVAKASSYWFTKIYREYYKIYCCTGILFNHESPLRSDEFVTKKIIEVSKKIKNNKKIKLKLGNINIKRDWGWAPEYVQAIWKMLQRKKPTDFIIGSGKVYSLKNFVDEVFKILKIKKENLIYNVSALKRNTDIQGYKADIKRTKKILGWKPKIGFQTMINKMIKDELF